MLFGIVGLTAPAPPGGVRIRLSSSGGELILLYPGPGGGPYLPFPQDIVVPEEKTQEIFMLVPSSVWVDTKVIISAYAPLTNDSRTATVTIRPPSLTSVRFGQLPAPSTQDPPTISSVPLGGKRILMWVRVDGYAPKGGLPVSLQYSGTTDVAGPSQVIVPDRARGHSFEVTVYPCGVNPPCRVVITARYRGSMVTATLTVNP